MARPLLLNAAELLRRPGSERSIVASLTIDELGLDDERFVHGDEISVELRLESLTDGIVVVGNIDVPWHGTCRRCLREIAEHEVSVVDELYQTTVTNPDAFEILGEQLDLKPMVREFALLDAPRAPLCRPDCRGLCPFCGIDLNESSCACESPPQASPWDALDQLKGQLDAK